MNKIVLFIMLFLMPAIASAQEVIAEMDAAGIATMNEELRQSSSGLKNLKGQVADLLPLDLSDTTKVENALPIANGGTGQTTAQAAINALTGVSSATNEYVLTKDTATGNAVFKEVSTLHNPFTAGDTFLVYSLDGTGSTTTSTPTLKKSIKLTRGGVLRIKFAINSGSGGTGHAQIYRNGSPVGQDRANVGSYPITFSEDISGWLPGDACQLYAWTIGGAGYYREFRIYSTTPSTEQTIADL